MHRLPRGISSKESSCQCSRCGFDPWAGKIPWRRERQPTPVFFPGESPWTEEPGELQSMGSQRVVIERLSTAPPSLVAQSVNNLSAVQEAQFRSLSWEDPLEKEMVAHSSILVWKIPWTVETGGLQSMRSQRVGRLTLTIHH